ncbi:MAG: DUF4135 domain-containing protein [Rhabdochlamydiaceae bacterium]|nr:DUF4135 domain-containing protein [Rhabdochlamydiaceae bacterium]
MSIPRTSESKSLSIHPQVSISRFSQLSLFAGSVKETIVGVVKKYPLFARSTIGAFAIGGLVAYKYYTSLDRSIERLVSNSSRLFDKACKENIGAFLERNWNKLGLPGSCKNIANSHFLENKLLRIIQNDHQPIILRQKIAKNVVRNFCRFIAHSLRRVEHDLVHDLQFRELFNIQGNPNIQRVEILGDETHNKGTNPLCIAILLPGDQRIIYKPRSVQSESLICGTNKSLFQRLNLPIYRVYEKQGESYGYCEYLVNLQEENTFNFIDELGRLYIEFGKIEKVARAIGLSDLHYDNIIISGKRPHLIDTEVVSMPAIEGVYQTHLFGVERPGALASTGESKNHIWLNRDLIQQFNLSNYAAEEIEEDLFETGMTGPALARSGLTDFIQTIANQTHPEITNFELGDLHETREALKAHANRIVLIDTQDLSVYIRQDIDLARNNFSDALKQGIGMWGFQVDENQWAEVLDKFEQDLRDNDVPIFYYRAATREIYYGLLRIAIQAQIN